MADLTYNQALKMLGLAQPYTEDDVKKAFRKLSRKHHPDVGGDPEVFKRYNEAKTILLNTRIVQKQPFVITHNTIFKVVKRA